MAFEYRHGPRIPRLFKLDSSAADILVGDAITITDATDGYVKEVDALGEAITGIAMQDVTSPSADGDKEILVDISELSVYEVPPDAGSITQALMGNSCDVGADARSIDINGSSVDNIAIHDVNVTDNKAHVSIIRTFTGV